MLLPPISTARIGRGIADSPGKRHRSAASLAAVTRWTAPLVTITLGPRSRSCSGTTSRSKSPWPTPGSWICAATVRPPLARRIASAGIAALRPQAMTRSGQGGSRRSPRLPGAARGVGHSGGGSRLHGKRIASRFSTKAKPVASASPIAWLAIPALPSCNTQPNGSNAIGRVYGNGSASARRRGPCGGPPQQNCAAARCFL